MEVDEDYLEFVLKFRIKKRELIDSEWFKQTYARDDDLNEMYAEMCLDFWEESDYDILKSLACCSDKPDWKEFLTGLEERNKHYTKMRQRMREERNG